MNSYLAHVWTFCLYPECTPSWMYIFRHDNLGDLGRIIVQGQPNGETKFTSELSAGPDDPMFKKRQEIFLPLSKKMIEFVESQLGRKARNEETKHAGPDK